MPFIDPDTIKTGATPETSPMAAQVQGFVDPDAAPKQAPQGAPQSLGDLSVPRQMASGAVGAPEALVSMGTGMAGMAAGGVAAIGKGAYNLAKKGFIDPDDMRSTMEGVSHAMTYEPRSIAGKEFTQGLGDLYSLGREYAGRGGEAVSNDSPLARSVAEFGFDAVLNALPFVHSLGRVRGAAKLREMLEEEKKKQDTGQMTLDKEPASSVRNRPESDYLYNPEGGMAPPTDLMRAGIKEYHSPDYPGGKVTDLDALEAPKKEYYEPGVQSQDARLREEEYTGPRTRDRSIPDNGIDYKPDSPAETLKRLDQAPDTPEAEGGEMPPKSLGAEGGEVSHKMFDKEGGEWEIRKGADGKFRIKDTAGERAFEGEFGTSSEARDAFLNVKRGGKTPITRIPKPVDPVEATWIKASREGDTKAFDRLARKYDTRLKRALSRYVMGDAVEDIAQTAWEHAFKAIKKFEGESNFFTWIYRIAINDSKNYFKMLSRRPKELQAFEKEEGLGEETSLEGLQSKSEEGQDSTTPESEMQSKQTLNIVQRALNKLPDDQHKIVQMRELDGLSYEDIAQIMNTPIGTVRSRLARAREALAKEIKRLRGDDTLGARFDEINFGEFHDRDLARVLSQTQNPRAGIEHIARKSETPFYRELAKKILADKEFKPKLLVRLKLSEDGRAAEFSPHEYEIRILPEHLGSEQILLHESMHARTAAAINAYLNRGETKHWNKAFTHLEAPVKRMFELYESLEKMHMDRYGPRDIKAMSKDKLMQLVNDRERFDPLAQARVSYGMRGGIHEFVAEGFTNPAFQSYLAQIKVPREVRGGLIRTYWDGFLDSVRKLFGIASKDGNYLKELLRAGSDMMEGIGKDERMYFSKNFMTEAHMDPTLGAELSLDPLDKIRKEINSKQGKEETGIMGSVIERAREFKLDKRPFDKFYDEELKDRQLQDFSPKSQNLVERVYNRLGALTKKEFLQDTTLSILMRNTEGTGPLLKWVVDQVSRIDRNVMIKTKDSIESGMNPFRRLYRTDSKLLGEMRDLWMDNIGRRELGPADFSDERQWKAYEAIQKVHEGILKELNEKRAGAGLKPIQKIPSYFHSMWDGDYRVFGYDQNGTKVWAYGYKTEAGAVKDMRKLQKAHPDVKWEQDEVKRDRYNMIDLSAFEEAMRVLSDDDPITQAIQKTYRDIIQHRGFGRTGLHKEGVRGFIGQSGDLRDVERAFTQYVEQAYRYMGNLDKQQVIGELTKIPKEQRDQIPMTMDFLDSYVHRARGGAGLIDWETKTLNELGNAVGLGKNAPKNLVRQLGQVAYMYWLTTPRFLASQTVQSINALPKLIQEYGGANGPKMFFDGWKETLYQSKFMPKSMRDPVSTEALTWAEKHQYLDPTIRNLMNKEMPWGERPTTTDQIREVLSWPAAWTEHNLVRAPVFLMFEKALRDTVSDKHERFEIAAQKADYYMVNYNRVHAPAVYDNLGIAGDMLRPLKMYSHNYIGQFMEYLQGAKNAKEYAPLAAFFGTQALVAGLKGTMFVAEASIAINLINYLFDTQIPTPEQALMKSRLHDLFVFGGLSTVLGRDVSSSVAAPGLKSMLNFPAVELTADVVHDVGNYAIQVLKGQETDQDRLRAWLAITPSALHEWLKNIYTQPGGTTANPFDPQLRGNYRRDEMERFVSTMTGTKKLDEARADSLVRSVKQELLRDLGRKMDALDAMSDRVKNGQNISPDLFQKYAANGGDPKMLGRNLVDRMKGQALTGPERMQDNQFSMQQAHRMQVLNPYLQNEYNDVFK